MDENDQLDIREFIEARKIEDQEKAQLRRQRLEERKRAEEELTKLEQERQERERNRRQAEEHEFMMEEKKAEELARRKELEEMRLLVKMKEDEMRYACEREWRSDLDEDAREKKLERKRRECERAYIRKLRQEALSQAVHASLALSHVNVNASSDASGKPAHLLAEVRLLISDLVYAVGLKERFVTREKMAVEL